MKRHRKHLWLLVGAGISFVLADAAHARDIQIGKIRLGAVLVNPPTDVIASKNCEDRRKVMSCELKLADNIWYRFIENRLVTKAIYDLRRNAPWWINYLDNIYECRRRVSKTFKREFEIFEEENGDKILTSRSLDVTSDGVYYDITIVYRRGRMIELFQSALPWT